VCQKTRPIGAAEIAFNLSSRRSSGVPTDTEANEVGIQFKEDLDISMFARSYV
jgi:hypothetical protein